ncbi:MAG: energy transducer TonB, partial [Flavobacteriaceae bacterium]|nr:energy transducer TonB [Flavobacteriaceae bacterium]
AEFFVDEAYQLIPIYRINLQDKYEIDTDDEKIMSLYDSINKNVTYKQPIKNILYFSTNENKDVTNIKVITNNPELKKIITSSIQSIKNSNPNIYLKLEKNKNYTLNSLLQKKGPDRHALFKGCNENLDNDQVLKCTYEKISKHVTKKFNLNLAKNIGLTGRQKILIGFKIDTEGNVFDVKARAPHPKLREEAIRVIKLIPKMKPASLNEKPIVALYSLPIIFVVE